jgi:DNA sulfur modification protein DndB
VGSILAATENPAALVEVNDFAKEVHSLTSRRAARYALAVTQVDAEFSFSFPAIRGIQAGREFYVAMCPLKHLERLLPLDLDDIPADFRAQRALNKGRLPALARYILENPKDYVFSSLTASVDGEVKFAPLGTDAIGRKLGTLHLPMDAKILVNDGQHRRAAIEEALKENRDLANETISVVFFVNSRLERSQQMFADLNRYAVRPTPSLAILYDHRDSVGRLCSRLVKSVPVFNGMTETTRSTISNRSTKLFTLSSIYSATRKLLGKREGELVTAEGQQLAHDFWVEVAKYMPDWTLALERKVSPCDLRRDYVHAHGLALQSIATAGLAAVGSDADGWRSRLASLKGLDWSRSNTKLWEGRAMVLGRISKAQSSVTLTSNVLKKRMGLSLDDAEKELERLHGTAGRH